MSQLGHLADPTRVAINQSAQCVQVVLLRTGVLVHIKKYMQTLGLLPLDVPEKPQEAAPGEEANSEGEDQPADTGTLSMPSCDASARYLDIKCLR